jgi:hypothetical protein
MDPLSITASAITLVAAAGSVSGIALLAQHRPFELEINRPSSPKLVFIVRSLT